MRGGGQMEHVQDTGNGQSKKREEEEQRKEVWLKTLCLYMRLQASHKMVSLSIKMLM